MRDMASEAGMRRGAQRRAAEDGGWRVETKSRRKMIHVGRGCEERMRVSGEATLKATDREGR